MAITRNPSSETRLPNVASMPFLQQGSTDGCGTCSLAMTMTYLGVPETQGAVDAVIRQFDIFSSPEDLMKFATSHGLQAQGYNHGLWENIESFIPLGQPCICLISADYSYAPGNPPDSPGLHYVAITGFGNDAVDNQRYVIFHDPNFPSEMVLYESRFVQMGNNVGWGFRDYYMAFANFASKVPLPPGNDDGIQGALGAVEGVTNITNGFGNIIHPGSVGSIFHGLFQIVGGIVQAFGAGIGTLWQLGAQWLHGVVDGIPVLSNIIQPIADILDGWGAVLGDVYNGIGSIFSDIGKGIGAVVDAVVNGVISIGRNLGGAFAALVRGNVAGFVGGLGAAIGSAVTTAANIVTAVVTTVANVVSDAATAVGNAVSDAANSVANAVSDFFSGW